MCEQNAFWFSDRKSLCAVMHPCFVSGGNFCLKFRKIFVVANLNSHAGWCNCDFPQYLQTNSVMFLQTIHNSVLLYTAYNSLQIIISTFEVVEPMELIDCPSIN